MVQSREWSRTDVIQIDIHTYSVKAMDFIDVSIARF